MSDGSLQRARAAKRFGTLAALVLAVGCGPRRASFTAPSGPAIGNSARPRAAPTAAVLPRLVAYVNCLCGFGVGTSRGACLDEPDPNVNHVLAWEERGESPITLYAIAFLSFGPHAIQTDHASVWASGGGSATDFELHDHVKRALRAAQTRGKRVWLSLGGEVGSEGFLAWWRGLGGSSRERTKGMRKELERVASRFESQNGIVVDGFDVDIELGGLYERASDKYAATRDLINAVPEPRQVAFAPQVGNGLCAAPVPGDPLSAAATLGGACKGSPADAESRWVLTRLDEDCKTSQGTPRLEYFGIQYYNVGSDESCGGGADTAATLRSTVQNYVNVSNGWAASTASDLSNGRTWTAYAGLGADRLVIGKPGCAGCASDGYLDPASMQRLIGSLDMKLDKPMGGVLFWDLCRLFGNGDDLCEANGCQPSWGGKDLVENLRDLKRRMQALRTRRAR
jgi:hypothetical protein